MDEKDRALGMGNGITRRDFLDGMAMAVGGAALTSAVGLGASESASPVSPDVASQPIATSYPPMKLGLRGFDSESTEAAHAVRDGKVSANPVNLDEKYDLVVVGAGMAGLSAAYFYLKQIPQAKILVIDGCDDFGGHARRNEFNVDGHQLLANGGTYAIWYPNTFTPEGAQLLKDIGVDIERWYKAEESQPDPLRELKLSSAMFFSKESYGVDRLVTDYPSSPSLDATPGSDRQVWSEFLSKTPFSDGAKAGLLELYTEKKDYMPGLSVQQKIQQLQKMSYVDYLLKVAHIHPDAVAYVRSEGTGQSSNQTAGMDTLSAWYAYRRKEYGFAGLGLPPSAAIRDGAIDPGVTNLTKNPGRHVVFPDGNAGVARLLIRWLIPEALPGSTMEDSVAGRINYALLDKPDNAVRVRLSSTAIRVKHLGDPAAAREVEISYFHKPEERVYRVRANAVVMACFNSVVPYLCPELPEAQKKALHWAVRKPLVYTYVAVRNWRAFQKLGVSNISCPNMFFTNISLVQKVSLGDYHNPTNPDEPILLDLLVSNSILEAPGQGLTAQEQWRAARAKLLSISFETFERNIRSQLARVLGPGGFDPARDIAGIIINRWGHAYATGSNALSDPDWTQRTDAPWVVGRQRFGRITISNSDAAATSLTQAAFQQSNRAVNEIINDIVRPVFDFHYAERDTLCYPETWNPNTLPDDAKDQANNH
jgi:spermidine dehydrogenase